MSDRAEKSYVFIVISQNGVQIKFFLMFTNALTVLSKNSNIH